MKTKLLKCLLIGLIVILQIESCKTENIALYSDIKYQAIPDVSLKEYKSVQLRDTKYQNSDLALGVAIAGGGSRAEYYGIGVLLGLEEIKKTENSETNFLKEVDYFSTISGGCYAAGYYLTIQKNLLSKNNMKFGDFYFSKGSKYKDFIGKSADKRLVLNNYKNEKGSKYGMAKRLNFEVLQYNESYPGDTNKFNSQMLMSDFFIMEGSSLSPTLPIFVPNTTIYNNGEKMPFMPHIIASLKMDCSLEPNKGEIPLGANGYNDGYNFPLKYAITASSAFPGVLPKVKFGVKDTDKILCFIDGGAVDNLGYKTLFELLDSDVSVTNNKNKKALVIDCSGEGKTERYSNEKRIKLLSLLETATMFTVSTKYVNYIKEMKYQLKTYDIPETNCLVIGFSTIREHLRELPKDDDYNTLITKLKNTKDENKNWWEFYKIFSDSIIKRFAPESFKLDEYGRVILSSLSTEKFKDFTPSEILMLYEYAAQVDTKLKIYADEREMLILAGRYTVYLEQDRIKSMLNTEK